MIDAVVQVYNAATDRSSYTITYSELIIPLEKISNYRFFSLLT